MSRAPWDMLPYFQTPLFVVNNIATPAKQLVPADPMRVLLIIFPAQAGSYTLSPNAAVAMNQGINMNTAGQPLIINESWWGPMVTLAWWAISGVAVTAPLISVSMASWPDNTEVERATPDAIQAAIQRLSRSHRYSIPGAE